MLSLPGRSALSPVAVADMVLQGLSENVFGQDGWATTVTHGLARDLVEALSAGRSGPFADCVRIVGHVPLPQHVRTIANAVCDAALTQATAAGAAELLPQIGELRRGANELLDRIASDRPSGLTPAATVDASRTLMQVVAVSRPDLHKHLQAVSALSVRIGRQLDIVEETIDQLGLAALLHDVGLLTTGTDPALAERDPGHAMLAERTLDGIEPLRHLAPIVRAHHERFDGAGQPDGLQGAEIPLESRIIAVADAFEHLANRPGRANPIVAAISELWQDAGSVYDPDVVAAVTRLFNQHWRSRRTASGAP
jgi:HD-GYP domain-containing protein (c-di-GMP phosphodiesterase class II)